MRLLICFALAGCLFAADVQLPLEVRYRVVKRAAQIAAREKQIAMLQEEIGKLNGQNQEEFKVQRTLCKGDITASTDDELVCRTQEAPKPTEK